MYDAGAVAPCLPLVPQPGRGGRDHRNDWPAQLHERPAHTDRQVHTACTCPRLPTSWFHFEPLQCSLPSSVLSGRWDGRGISRPFPPSGEAYTGKQSVCPVCWGSASITSRMAIFSVSVCWARHARLVLAPAASPFPACYMLSPGNGHVVATALFCSSPLCFACACAASQPLLSPKAHIHTHTHTEHLYLYAGRQGGRVGKVGYIKPLLPP